MNTAEHFILSFLHLVCPCIDLSVSKQIHTQIYHLILRPYYQILKFQIETLDNSIFTVTMSMQRFVCKQANSY